MVQTMGFPSLYLYINVQNKCQYMLKSVSSDHKAVTGRVFLMMLSFIPSTWLGDIQIFIFIFIFWRTSLVRYSPQGKCTVCRKSPFLEHSDTEMPLDSNLAGAQITGLVTMKSQSLRMPRVRKKQKETDRNTSASALLSHLLPSGR